MRGFLRMKNIMRPLLIGGVLGTLYLSQRVNLNVNNPNDIKKYSDLLHNAITKRVAGSDDFKNKNALIICGNSNKELAQEIASYLNTTLGNVRVDRFADGECDIQVIDSIRERDIYIIQPTCPPVNENLMELLILVTTLRRASARKINVVVPYYGYSRQDRKIAPRVPISAADVARLLETVGIDRLIAVDLHCGQIQGFFGPRVPVDNLEANLVYLNYLRHQKDFDLGDVTVVSPDAGGVGRAKKFHEQIKKMDPKTNVNLAFIFKQREGAGKIAQMNLVGQVKDRDAIIIDDIIDTAGTLTEAAKVLKQMGAKRVFAFATHGLFSGKAFENIKNSALDQIIVTNTIPVKSQGEAELGDKIKRLSVAPLLAEAIYRIQMKDSVTNLFAEMPKYNTKE